MGRPTASAVASFVAHQRPPSRRAASHGESAQKTTPVREIWEISGFHLGKVGRGEAWPPRHARTMGRAADPHNRSSPGRTKVRSPLRCALLRASKDGVQLCACGHPSRRGEAAAPQDEVGDSFTAAQDDGGVVARGTTFAAQRSRVSQPLRMQDHLAHCLAAREHFQGVGGLRQREGAIDMR
jgi:hypothetical protein